MPRSLEALVDAFLVLLLIDYVRDSGVLDGLSRVMRTAAFVAILFVAFQTLNLFWARVRRLLEARSGSSS